MARVPRRARAAIDRLTRCGTEAALRPPPVCCASASGHDHVTARFQGANVPLGLPQRPRQSEMREDAAIGKPRCGRDPLTLEREDEQRVRARDGGLRRRQLHANAGWPFRPRRGLPSTSIRRRDPFEGCIPCWEGVGADPVVVRGTAQPCGFLSVWVRGSHPGGRRFESG
jgi:hypothetical protein